ncbi:MAG TPA: gliding motility protein GldM [Draconibacterium sp.]|nr:gliding motility protein GldM [Draconibacterium sp.]
MGAKNCPETPRQKMINMMYIVLTAMLALNVASEVLEAFRLIDSSLIHTLNAVDMKNQQIYSSFEQAYLENPAKVQEWKQKADEVQNKSKEINVFISTLKEDLVNYSGSELISADNPYEPGTFILITQKGDTLQIKKEDDLNGTSEFMITQKKASELKDKINTYKNELVAVLGDEDAELKDAVLRTLETNDPVGSLKETSEKKTWESMHFENTPMAAILTVLSKIQIDVKNSEANVLNYLYSQIDAGSFKFNKLGARVIANSNIVFQGEPYEAEVFLAAEDTTQQPEISINGRPAEVKDGKAIYKVSTSEPGVFKWSGLIKYKTPDGIFKDYKFEQTYQVTKPSITMSATKMNVFYRGLDNPFDISGGIPKEDLEIEMENGKVTKSGDAFLIRPTELDEQGKRTKVTVFAKVNGTRKIVGTSYWRVKKVPDPVAQVAGKSGGDIRKEVLAIQDGVLAVLEDFDFDFKYKVTQFELQTTGAGGYTIIKKSTSNRFTTEQKELLKRSNPESLVYIGNIKAIGDDGSTRDLKGITFTVK